MITKNKALFLAQHCENVYEDNHKPDTKHDIKRFKKENINGYAFEDKGTVYIFIAGTDDIKDVLADMKFISTRLDNESFFTRVHTGFYNSYKKIEKDIFKIASQNKPIVIAGHSLGGAIAIIAKYELSKIGINVSCVTFGAPRVGGYLFAKKYNKLDGGSYHFINKNDAVTRVPKTLYFRVDTDLQSKGKSWFPWFRGGEDHYIENYIDSIKKDMWSLET